MSDSQDAKQQKRARQNAQALLENPPDVWSFDQVKSVINAGLELPAGARITAPQSAKDFYAMDLGPGASPDPMIGLDEFMGKSGLNLQQYQDKYQGLPFVFNPDGTATYDPTAQKNSYSYNNPDDGLFHKIMPMVMGGLATAGLTGLLPGTTSVFGGAASGAGAAGGAMDMGIGLGGELGAWGGITPIAEGAGTVAGTVGGTSIWDIPLGDFSSALELGGDAAGGAMDMGVGLGGDLGSWGGITPMDMSAGGAMDMGVGLGGSDGAWGGITPLASGTGAAQTASQALSQLLKSGLGIDASPGMLSLLGQLGGAGLGLLGSNQQSNALESLQNQMTAQRAPFLNKATGYLNDPASFYSSPEATGAADATMRALSTKFGNPGTSPTAQGLATGALYDRYLNTVNSYGSLGLGGQGIQANLGQQIASSSGQPYAIGGNLLGGLTGENQDMNQLIAQMKKQFGQSSFGLP